MANNSTTISRPCHPNGWFARFGSSSRDSIGGTPQKPRDLVEADSTVGVLLVRGAAAGFGTIGIFGEIALAIDLSLATLFLIRVAVVPFIVIGLALGRGWPIPRSRRDRLAALGLGVIDTPMIAIEGTEHEVTM